MLKKEVREGPLGRVAQLARQEAQGMRRRKRRRASRRQETEPQEEESDPRHRAMFTAYQLQQYDKEPGSVISQMSLCSTVRACPDKPPPSQP